MDTSTERFALRNQTFWDDAEQNGTSTANYPNSTSNKSLDTNEIPAIGIELLLVVGLNVIVSFIILISNSLVILILYRKEILRGTTSTFMISLAAGDLITGFTVFHCALVDTNIFKGHLLSLIACELCTLTANSCAGITTSSLLAIAIERYISIAYPYAYVNYMTQKIARITIVCIFTLWLVLSTGLAFYYIHNTWVEGSNCWAIYLYPIDVFHFLAVLVYGTLALSLITYSLIFKKAAETARQVQIQETVAGVTPSRRENKVTKMMALMFGAFIVCYLPTNLTILIMGKDIATLNVIITHIPWLLFLSNSFMNPIIFFWKSPRFRHALKQLLHIVPHNSVAPEI